MKVKVLHIISGLNTGGAETFLSRLVAARGEVEHGVVSLSAGEGTLEAAIRAAQIPVWRVPMIKGLPLPGFWKSLNQVLKDWNPDIIQGWLYRGNWAALVAAGMMRRWKKTPVPVYWNIRHSLSDWKGEELLFRFTVLVNRYFSPRPDLVLFNSREAQSQHTAFGFHCQKTLVIPNGFDLSKIKLDREQRLKLRLQWGIPETAVVGGLVGRYHPTKGHKELLEAWRLIQAQGSLCYLVLIGKNTGPENPELKESFQALPYPDRVLCLGEQPEAYKLTMGFDFCLNTSRGEAFSNVIGEALALEKPCIVTDVGDSRWIVGDAGKVIPPRDPEALAQALLWMEGLPPQERDRLGKLGRERMERDFELERVKQMYTEIYTKALDIKKKNSNSASWNEKGDKDNEY